MIFCNHNKETTILCKLNFFFQRNFRNKENEAGTNFLIVLNKYDWMIHEKEIV